MSGGGSVDRTRRPAAYLAIALLSAAILGYEVLLARLLAIVHWQSFASMVVSVALLGYGASGVWLALGREPMVARFEQSFAVAAAAFGVLAIFAFAIGQRLPFNALAVFWEPRQLGWLVALYALLFIPFFCGATAMGLSFATWGAAAPRAYAADLVGAGIGATATLALLLVVRAERVLVVIAASALASGVAMASTSRGRGDRRLAVVLAMGLLALPVWLPREGIEPRSSPWKSLPKTLAIPGTAITAERSSPMGLVSVVESRQVPFREAPGLSLVSPHPIPEQVALFVDGDAMTALTRFDGDLAPLAFLDDTPQAAPYHVRAARHVLVIGMGGGSDVLLARFHGADTIDAVETNPDVVRLVREDLRGLSSFAFDPPRVRAHVADGRSFLESTSERYDLIQLSLLDSPGLATSGGASASESFLYTVESFATALQRLKPGGWLSASRWLEIPPRSSLKLAATVVAALEATGSPVPARQLVLLRSWNRVTILVKNGAVDAAEAAALVGFAEKRLLDLDYLAGEPTPDRGAVHLLDQPYLREGIEALLGDQRRQFLDDYAFDIRPATDDRPYFHDFFRWRALARILALPPQGGAALLELGYPIVVATLVQAIVLSALLVLLPLALHVRRERARASAALPGDGPASHRVPALVYFGALGLAFLFLEIGFVQRLVLLLGHPLYALGVVLAAFLVFAGLGSALAPRLARAIAWRGHAPVTLAVLGIATVALLEAIALPPLVARAAGWSLGARIALALAVIAPLAVPMGMPFSLGLARLSAVAPELVPWAWGVNGCASVLSAPLASLLAIHAGFRAVTVVAVALYGVAGLAYRGLRAPREAHGT